MPQSTSIKYFLRTAFDFEIRNKIEIRLSQLNEMKDLSDEQADEIRLLNTVHEYLKKRMEEIKL